MYCTLCSHVHKSVIYFNANFPVYLFCLFILIYLIKEIDMTYINVELFTASYLIPPTNLHLVGG